MCLDSKKPETKKYQPKKNCIASLDHLFPPSVPEYYCAIFMLITPRAKNSSLNLSRKLQDKEKIYLFCKNPQHPSMFYCNNGMTGK